jgi:imidazolonepropionase-like amidohydrolase
MILFKNTSIFDGSGSEPFPGEVLVKDNRIVAVSRAGAAALSAPQATIVDGTGTTLMPGMTEAHAHLSWPSSVERFVPGMSLSPEDLVLNTAPRGFRHAGPDSASPRRRRSSDQHGWPSSGRDAP